VYPVTAGIVIETKALWDELQAALQDLPVRVLIEQSEIGEWSSFLEKIERMRPEVVFLDVTQLREPLDQSIRRIKSTGASPAVFALNKAADSETILGALRAGAVEYLYPPFAEALRAGLERMGAERKKATQSVRRGGNIIGFLSAKGGCGATTVACHTAIELPHQTKSKVLLADLDFDSGMIGFLLKSKSPYTIIDAARNTQRLDENYWKALVSNGFAGLEVITAPVPPVTKVMAPENLKFVLSFLRTQYDWVVIDLGRSLNILSASALEDIDQLFLVTTLEVPALHQTKQLVQKLLDSGYPATRLRLLLNRAPKSYDVTMQELETMLGVPVYSAIPNDYSSLNESYSEGKMLGPGTHLGKHFARLAMKIAGVETQAKKKFSLFG
jgi:pilus assembly protein CpaE